jgi:transposase
MSHAMLVDEGFWEMLEALLPRRPRQRTGRPRVSDRAAFTAIVSVLVTGCRGESCPRRSAARE